MSKWKLGLMIATEDHRQFADVTPLTGFNQIEQNQLDIHESFSQIKEMNDTIDEASQGAQELQAIAECLKDENVSSSAAKIASISTEAIYKRLGIVKKRSPSLESFECKIALEGIVKTAKEIWDKIVAAIKKTWEKITDFFKNLFNQNKQIEKSYKEAEAALDAELERVKEDFIKSQGTELTDSKIAEITRDTKMQTGSWFKNLTLQGEFDEKKIADNLDIITGCAKAYGEYAQAIVQAAGTEQKLNDIEKAFTDIEKAAKDLDKKLPDLIMGEYNIKLDTNHHPAHPFFTVNQDYRDRAAEKYKELQANPPNSTSAKISAAGLKLCEEIDKIESIESRCKHLFEAIDKSIKNTNPEHYGLVGPKLTAITKAFSISTTEFLKTFNAINSDVRSYCAASTPNWLKSLATFDKGMASDKPFVF